MKYHYVYKTTCIPTKKFYIGIRSTDEEPSKDPYLGSGVLLIKSVKKYGQSSFQKEILAIFNSRIEASNLEKTLVTQEIVLNDNCYNLKTGGHNQHFHHPDTREKIRKGNSKPLPEQTKQNMSKASPKCLSCMIQGCFFHSVREAAKVLNIPYSTIQRRCQSTTTKFLDYYYVW